MAEAQVRLPVAFQHIDTDLARCADIGVENLGQKVACKASSKSCKVGLGDLAADQAFSHGCHNLAEQAEQANPAVCKSNARAAIR